jgi:ABC-type spermidine/putrescine transport system permease subunit II
MLPVAHAGHYVLWFLYLPPLAVVIFSITRSKLAERRERRQDQRD